MKQYLMISNKGKIIPQDIILMGSSTKRGDDTKIGQFGSGSKFSLSWLLRNNCSPIIYSGVDEIAIETRMTEHRGHPRDVIYVAGENTNITTELGLKWTCWMALRELISNAIDEGEEKIEIVYVRNDNFTQFCDDQSTHIFIPLEDSLKEVMEKYDHFFAFDRQPDYIHTDGMIYIKPELGLSNVYRKGIRCWDCPRSMLLDFNFNNIPITEDRLIEGDEGTFDRYAKKLLQDVDNKEVIKAAVMGEYKDILPFVNVNDSLPVIWLEAYQEMIDSGITFTTRTLKDNIGMLSNGTTIPERHFKLLVNSNKVSNPIEAVFQHLDFVFNRVDGPTEQVKALLAQFGTFHIYYGKMDTYKDIKYKTDTKEFFIKHTLVKENVHIIAAKCIMACDDNEQMIVKLLNK